MKELIVMIVICLVLIGGGLALKKINFAQLSATDPSTFVYVQDDRTGICFAQTSNAMAAVPCEAVQEFLD